MKKTLFGTMPSGEAIYSYKLENDKIFAEIITYGAILKSFGVADKNRISVVGSYDTLQDYINDTTYQGSIVGRVANRIENARFTIDSKEYLLPTNDGSNCHHGGDGFNSKVWNVKAYEDNFIELTYYSKDGESGFPGGLDVTVKYILEDDALVIDFTAIPDKKTPINLTNHAYFNLDGVGSDIYSHKVTVYANTYSVVNSSNIPTGEHPEIEGTLFDLRGGRILGEALKSDFGGYDHNFCLAPVEYATFLGKSIALAAKASNETTELCVYTDMPGVQLYTGNALACEPDFAGGKKKTNHGAFCFEAQFEPNSVNHGIGIYGPGEVYKQTTVYRLKKL